MTRYLLPPLIGLFLFVLLASCTAFPGSGGAEDAQLDSNLGTNDTATDNDAAIDSWEAPVNPELCLSYTDSSLYRLREERVTVGPDDDWIGIIQSAAPSSEILLVDGVYEMGSTYAVVVGDEVTIRSQSGERDQVLIQGAGYGPGGEGFMVLGENVTIADLSMTQIRNHAISIKGDSGPHATHIYNVHIFDIGTQHIKLTPGGTRDGIVACSSLGYSEGGAVGDYVNAIDLLGAIDWHIRDNTIYNITGDGSGCEVDIDCGTYISGPAILVWRDSSGTLIERNTLIDCFRNIALGLGSSHEGGLVRNNFIYRSEVGDAGVELHGADGARVYHNTVLVAGYSGAIEFRQSTNLRIFNNLISAPVWDRGDTDVTMGGNIDSATDDDFISPGDPHLVTGSRAIGAGELIEDVTTDIDGDSRGDRVDVGADHFTN